MATKPQEPAKPAPPPWLTFREAFNADTDTVLECKWTGGNRLEIHTDNVQRVTLDLTRLPAGAPQRGPWIVQIDRQGIQITGARGKVLDLVRSPNGNWSVDLEKAPSRR